VTTDRELHDQDRLSDETFSAALEVPFGPPITGWRAAPDCDRCKDTGRYCEGTTEAHCGCKRGRKASELWYADKHGLDHPDMPEPTEPDFEAY
jgi:hypothetical protein